LSENFDVNQKMTVGEAVAHFYSVLGVMVPAHLEASISTDTENDGSINNIETKGYNAKGQITSKTTDYNGNGNIDISYVYTFLQMGYSL